MLPGNFYLATSQPAFQWPTFIWECDALQNWGRGALYSTYQIIGHCTVGIGNSVVQTDLIVMLTDDFFSQYIWVLYSVILSDRHCSRILSAEFELSAAGHAGRGRPRHVRIAIAYLVPTDLWSPIYLTLFAVDRFAAHNFTIVGSGHRKMAILCMLDIPFVLFGRFEIMLDLAQPHSDVNQLQLLILPKWNYSTVWASMFNSRPWPLVYKKKPFQQKDIRSSSLIIACLLCYE